LLHARTAKNILMQGQTVLQLEVLMREATFNGLCTIQPDFTANRYDDNRRRSRERAKTHPYSVSDCYKDKVLKIRQEWRKCFAGREEYA
jgi:hypothetical protein